VAIRNLLYAREYPINEHISICIPTVGQILENEENYYGMNSIITATPRDMMVQLDDMGLDFRDIIDYDLFLMTFNMLKDRDTSLIFGELNLNGFEAEVNKQNETIVLKDPVSGIVIDRSIYVQICTILRKIHHIEIDTRKPGNDEAKKFMIERARKKMARRKGKEEESQIESLIVALVNTEQCSYKFEDILSLTIYQFNESVRQIVSKIDYDNRMHGVYAGTISAKEMKSEDLNWLIHK